MWLSQLPGGQELGVIALFAFVLFALAYTVQQFVGGFRADRE
ncbi:hypothetical protein HAPAU_09750 [Halalkalicoccus paucihalophilus]|uniref:Uncharacterized protein n=1 Tax=Halalkalicoccus paucihalophilus TaxID=1008153 RepID=A0A151AHP1_9EURY|nr:hypothetical protein [Halalkalicoccus paucihalophilus]KYH27085.1 hypothetical protein HAPAU_09750 [Halalkalicoccus paucihalophilus]